MHDRACCAPNKETSLLEQLYRLNFKTQMLATFSLKDETQYAFCSFDRLPTYDTNKDTHAFQDSLGHTI